MQQEQEQKQHQRLPNGGWSIEAGKEILKAIFPNYPELHPCNPCPEWAKK